MWQLFIFGMLIGLLAALSTAVGTTGTLIGLLFVLIGGSLLNWFGAKKADGSNQLGDAEVDKIAEMANGLALGAILGLLLGFGLQTADLFLIRPNVPPNRAEKAIEDLKADLKAAQAALPKAPAEGDKAKVAELTAKLDAISAKLDKPKDLPPPRPVVVETQAGADINKLKRLGEILGDEVGKANAPDTALLDEAKGRLYEAANSLKGADEAIGKLRPQADRLSKRARAELDALYPPPPTA